MNTSIQRIVGTVLIGLLLGCAVNREIRLADDFAGQGNWEGAVYLYQEAVKKDPKNLDLRRKMEIAKANAAKGHYQKGREHLKEKNLSLALDEFTRAMTLDPARQEHQQALNEALRLKEARDLYQSGLKLMRAEKYSEALAQLEQALDLDPSMVDAQEAIRNLISREQSILAREDELTLKSTQPITLKFQNARLNEVFEFLSKASGVNILFDKDVRPESVNVTIFVRNASFQEALNLILTTNNLFMKKISEDTILIVPRTKQKVDQYQDLLIRTFYLSSVKAEDMVNLLRTMLETRRVYVNKELNTLVLRDTPEKIKLAEKIIEANDRMVAEVMFEVEIIEVQRNKKLQYGLSLTDNQIRAGIGKSGGTGAERVVSLETFRGDYTYFFTVPSVIVDFLKTEGDAKTLANPRIRVLDNKQAEITVGEKFPIKISTTTTQSVTATTTGGLTETQSTEFKDVAIKLGVKPKVHLGNDVTLELTLDITSLGSFVEEADQFSFGNRSAKTVLNVKNGETVVIGGLIRDDDRVSRNKIPGLGDIPVLGYFFSSTTKEKQQSDVLLTITPRVIRGLEPPERDLQYFWSGTEASYDTKPLFSDLPTTADSGGEAFEGGAEGVPSPPRIIPPAPLPPATLPPVPAIPSPSTISPSGHPPSAPRVPSLARMSVETNPPILPPAQEVMVGVRMDGVQELSEARVSLAYDPAVLEFKRAAEGDLMGRDGINTSFVSTVNPASGQVEVHIKRVSDHRGVNGSGLLFSLVFSGKEAGASPISLRSGSFLDPLHSSLSVSLSGEGQVRIQ